MARATVRLEEVIEGGPFDAPIADAKMDQADFRAESPLEWPLEDVDPAINAAHGSDLPLLAALSLQWHLAVDAGHEDISAALLALGPSRSAGCTAKGAGIISSTLHKGGNMTVDEPLAIGGPGV